MKTPLKAIALLSFLFCSLTASAGDLTWTVPDTWEDLKQSSSMRLATLAVKEDKSLLVKVSRFPGHVGGELANVNRWRGQLGLKGIKSADLEKELTVIETKAGKAKLLDISNNGKQMLAVMLKEEKYTYFFKLMGTSDKVGKQKEALIELTKSIK
ncbi:MAG: hypothetical protein NE334_08000 [Lentisphaeraceae bacterium]|nr:hypothetical protein [Lentisphaeraceae bacterium]